MSAYNILFPFLIILALGTIIFVLTRHVNEAVEHEDLMVKKEKRRWWQLFLGKGEGFLRYLRLKILQLDGKLSDSIKKVKDRKEKIGEGLREYRGRNKAQELQRENASLPNQESEQILEEIQEETKELETSLSQVAPEEELPAEEPRGSFQEEGLSNLKVETKASKLKQGISEAFKMFKKGERSGSSSENKFQAKPAPIKTKTFTPTEIKVEREYYLKKKEELLIQAIVNEPRNVGLYLQLGRIYFNQKNFADAKSAFEEALRLDKTNIKAKEELKRIEKMGG